MYDLNWVDYVILGVFGLSILAGLARGLVREVISLLTLIAAFAVATFFASPLAVSFTQSDTVQSVVSSSAQAQPSYPALGLSFGVLFLATWIVGAIIGAIVRSIMRGGETDFINRLLGAMFGFCRGFLINLVLIFMIQMTSFASDDAWKNSQLVQQFQPAIQWVEVHVSPSLQELIPAKSD